MLKSFCQIIFIIIEKLKKDICHYFFYKFEIFNDKMQLSNFENIFLTLWIFYFDILGNDDNDLQLLNISLIFLTLLVFHFDISGNNDNDLQL